MNTPYIICVGAPFDSQEFYGPFESFDAADQWSVGNLKQYEYTWIVSLHKPTDPVYPESEKRS